MDTIELFATILSLSAVLAYANERFIGLPNSIGVMLIGLLLSLLLLVMNVFVPGVEATAKAILEQVDFDRTLLDGMLSFLLFAGALHVNVSDLHSRRWTIGLLATVGVVISTALVGLATWGLSLALGLDLPLIWCFVFGALISPTDPIAVLGILKRLGAPHDLRIMITGESLFNDGIGYVIFLVLAGVAVGGGHDLEAGSALGLFVQEALGGAVFGFGLGYIGYRMLRSIDNYNVEVLLTLAMVMGGYALATKLHLSGPIAIVVAGLFAGNKGRQKAMSDVTRQRLDDFWELLDEILNIVLFVLIGLEVLILTFEARFILAGVLAIPMVLAVRAFAVGVPISLLRKLRPYPPSVVKILTWGGLRGGISVAMALSLPAIAEREPILVMTYIVVIFSIAVQGLTVGRLIASTQGLDETGESDPKGSG